MQQQPGPPEIPMREYLERIMDERDRLYDARFRAAEIAVVSAFDAQKEAIGKAENAQTAYNVAHNDLAHKMELQGKETMPRPEILGLFKAEQEKLLVLQNSYDARLEALRASFDKDQENVGKEIASLRETRSAASGKAQTMNAVWGYIVAAAGLGLALIFHFFPK